MPLAMLPAQACSLATVFHSLMVVFYQSVSHMTSSHCHPTNLMFMKAFHHSKAPQQLDQHHKQLVHTPHNRMTTTSPCSQLLLQKLVAHHQFLQRGMLQLGLHLNAHPTCLIFLQRGVLQLGLHLKIGPCLIGNPPQQSQVRHLSTLIHVVPMTQS